METRMVSLLITSNKIVFNLCIKVKKIKVSVLIEMQSSFENYFTLWCPNVLWHRRGQKSQPTTSADLLILAVLLLWNQCLEFFLESFWVIFLRDDYI